MKKRMTKIVFSVFPALIAAAASMLLIRQTSMPSEEQSAQRSQENNIDKEWKNFTKFYDLNNLDSSCAYGSYSWDPGARQMYRLKIWNGVRMEGQKTPQSLIDLEGTLNFRIIKIDDNDEVHVGMQLSPVSATIDGKRRGELEQLFQTFFMVTFNQHGSIVKFNFPPQMEEKDASSIKEVINALQFVIPPKVQDQKNATWVVEEQNSLGRYNAQYDFSSDNCLYSKRKQDYTELEMNLSAGPAQKQETMAADVIDSTVIARIEENLSWLGKTKGKERTQIYQGRRLLSDLESKVFLDPIPYNPDTSLTIWNDEIAGLESALKTVATQPGTSAAWDSVTLSHLREKYKDVDIIEALRKLDRSILEDTPHSVVLNAVKELVQHLSAYPKRALLLPEQVRSMSESSARVVFSALETSGDSYAQRALSQIMSDEYQNNYNRLHAIVSSGGVEIPQDEIVDSLIDIVEQRVEGDDAHAERGNTALLALGTMGDSVRDENEELTDQIGRVIDENLENASSAEEKTVAIKAMTNIDPLDDQYACEEMSAFLEDINVEVQRAALEAIKNAPEECRFKKAYPFFMGHPDSRLRITAFNVLKTVDHPERVGKLIQATLDSLVTETNPHLKTITIQYLGEKRSIDGRIVPALLAQLERETTRAIAKIILRAVYETS